MSYRTEKLEEELNALIKDGKMLLKAMEHEAAPTRFREAYFQKFKDDEGKVDDLINQLPVFNNSYQAWYSKAQAVIKQVLPDRLVDFVSYYEIPKNRKSVDFQNYVIKDYLQGLRITNYNQEIIVGRTAAIPEFRQQLNIVRAAKSVLGSRLMGLAAVLQADLFDTEIDSAAALFKAGYLRAAGAMCGVVVEKHLHHVCETHSLTVRKKNPGISDLSQLLKEEHVISVPQWRFIQHLADIRNICDHAKGNEPKKDELQDLISGTKKVLKTVF